MHVPEASAELLANKQGQMSENGAPPRDDLVRALWPGVELRDADADGGMPTMVGHFARFDEWARIDSIWEGTFMERIAPGAFKKTFRENRDRIRSLFQHGRDPQIGDKPLGPVAELREEEEGAYYEVPLLDAPYVREGVLPGLEANLYGASFRFQVMKEEFEAKPKRSKQNPEGLPERTVTEARVHEFGPVTFPAYAGATAGLRSLTDEFVFSSFLRQPERLRELLESTGAAALPSRKPEPAEDTEATTSEDGSRSTRPRHDYLNTGKERPPWQL